MCVCVCVWGGLFACVVVGICLYACVFELSLYCQARGRYMFYDVIENVITFVLGSWGNLKTGLAHRCIMGFFVCNTVPY